MAGCETTGEVDRLWLKIIGCELVVNSFIFGLVLF